MPAGSKPGERRGGRVAGTPNKMTHSARMAITLAAEGLEGAGKGLLEWAKSSEENLSTFWSRIYPRLVGTIKDDEGDRTIGHYIISDKPMTTEQWEAMIEKQFAGKGN